MRQPIVCFRKVIVGPIAILFLQHKFVAVIAGREQYNVRGRAGQADRLDVILWRHMSIALQRDELHGRVVQVADSVVGAARACAGPGDKGRKCGVTQSSTGIRILFGFYVSLSTFLKICIGRLFVVEDRKEQKGTYQIDCFARI
jgi:hypothetical protein